MSVTRRLAVLSLSVAAAAGLALPAVLDRGQVPRLAAPVEIVTERGDDRRSARLDPPPRVPSSPVPVLSRVQRDDHGRPELDDDDGEDSADDSESEDD